MLISTANDLQLIKVQRIGFQETLLQCSLIITSVNFILIKHIQNNRYQIIESTR